MRNPLKKIVIVGLALVACDFFLCAWYWSLVKRRFEKMNPAGADRAQKNCFDLCEMSRLAIGTRLTPNCLCPILPSLKGL